MDLKKNFINASKDISILLGRSFLYIKNFLYNVLKDKKGQDTISYIDNTEMYEIFRQHDTINNSNSTIIGDTEIETGKKNREKKVFKIYTPQELLKNITYDNYQKYRIMNNEIVNINEIITYQLFMNRTFIKHNFYDNNANQDFLNIITSSINNHNITESDYIKKLLIKFTPKNGDITIPQSKLPYINSIDAHMFINYIENMYFCEYLCQLFSPNKKKNIISIDGEYYNIFLSTIYEDMKGTDIILQDNQGLLFSIDITTNINKDIGKKHLHKAYFSHIILNYSKMRNGLRNVIEESKSGDKKSIGNIHHIHKKTTEDYINDLIQQAYQNNTPSFPYPNTDNNVVMDL